MIKFCSSIKMTEIGRVLINFITNVASNIHGRELLYANTQRDWKYFFDLTRIEKCIAL